MCVCVFVCVCVCVRVRVRVRVRYRILCSFTSMMGAMMYLSAKLRVAWRKFWKVSMMTKRFCEMERSATKRGCKCVVYTRGHALYAAKE